MTIRQLLLSAIAATSMVAMAGSAQATFAPCNPIGSASTCNLTITIGSGGITTVDNGVTPYDGSDDQYIGVFNNSSHTVNSLTVMGGSGGQLIYGFDGDGIDGYVGIAPNSMDPSGYGGPQGYFTNAGAGGNNVTVNFIGGIAPGANAYFSLEAPASINEIVRPAPEPAGFAVAAIGLAGLVLVRRRRA